MALTLISDSGLTSSPEPSIVFVKKENTVFLVTCFNSRTKSNLLILKNFRNPKNNRNTLNQAW